MEKINHPKHYNEHPAGIECIDVIEAFNFNLGSVIKYVWRAGLKPGENDLDDLRKAEWFLQREIASRENKSDNQPAPQPKVEHIWQHLVLRYNDGQDIVFQTFIDTSKPFSLYVNNEEVPIQHGFDADEVYDKIIEFRDLVHKHGKCDGSRRYSNEIVDMQSELLDMLDIHRRL